MVNLENTTNFINIKHKDVYKILPQEGNLLTNSYTIIDCKILLDNKQYNCHNGEYIRQYNLYSSNSTYLSKMEDICYSHDLNTNIPKSIIILE